MGRAKGLLLALVAAIGMLLVPLSRAQDEEPASTSRARIVRLSYAEGSVQLATNRGVENATINVPLTEGDRLSTSSNGWAEVQLEDGSAVRLAPSTAVTFTELGRDSSGSTLTTVDLDQGEAEFNVSRKHDDQFAVTVNNKTVLVKHSGRFRVSSSVQNPLEVVVYKGEVGVKDPDSGQQVAVKKDETFTLDPMDPSHYALDKEAQSDELDRWSQQRDTALAEYASNGNGNYAESPYQYGMNDLSYYGTYYNVPGYGYMWQPYGAGLGWDPFMNGYWTLTPFGYCWVSAYPWGWLPYRYGNWIFVNGSGWMWQPGSSWIGWWRRPHLVNAPPGFHPPAPPPRSSIGTVTMNPRAPRTPFTQLPGNRPRRVFTNEDVERTPPVHAATEPAIAARPGAVTSAERRPATEKKREPVPDTGMQQGRSSVGEIHRGHEHVRPVPATAPAPPVHAQPAPAMAPSHPAPAPASHISTPAPAPHVSAPPAPRSFGPPPSAAPHVGGGSMSHGSAPSTSVGRPK